MILAMTKYHENLLRGSPLSLLFMAKIFSSLQTKMVLKIPNETFVFRRNGFIEGKSVLTTYKSRTGKKKPGKEAIMRQHRGLNDKTQNYDKQLLRCTVGRKAMK